MATLAFDRNALTRGGATGTGKISYTVAEAAETLTRSNIEWAAAANGITTVSYAFRASGAASSNGASGFSTFNAQQIQITEQMLQAWSDVANIRFMRVGSGTGSAAYSDDAAILFGNFTGGSESIAGYAFYPGSTDAASVSGDVWIDGRASYNIAPAIGNYGAQVLVHEIGHAIGLDHPSDYAAGDGASYSYANSADYYEDSLQYSVMSYFSADNTGASQSTSIANPLVDDIAAAQSLYGVNLATRTGNTVYGFNATADRAWFSATDATTKLVFAAWDAGGTDSFDFSGYAQDQRIDLRTGRFSDVGGDRGNVTIADGATIENAIGGSGNDLLIGNAVDNVLIGNAGNDSFYGGSGRNVIDGGSGADTLLVNGLRADFVTLAGGDGRWTVFAPDGARDTITSVENISGIDGVVSFDSFATTNSGALRYIASNADLIAAFGTNAAAGAQHYAAWGQAEGRGLGFDPLRYAASNPDLARAFGVNADALTAHYISDGVREGRPTTTFDPYVYGASNIDLARALGDDASALTRHYIAFGLNEGRATATFDPYAYAIANVAVFQRTGLDRTALTRSYLTEGVADGRPTTSDFSALRYAASNPDLARIFGTNVTALQEHYLLSGLAENRSATAFDAVGYALVNPDLRAVFGFDVERLERHYIENGIAEGRGYVRFDPLVYAASNPDLAQAFGLNAGALIDHYSQFGRAEGRVTDSFDPVLYAASNPDIARVFGADSHAAAAHYIINGLAEGRVTTGFDSVAYLLSYGDAQGTSADAAALHYLRGGVNSHPDPDGFFGREQTAHDLIPTSGGSGVTGSFETIGDRDWYAFALTSAQTVTIDLAGIQGSVDTYLYLHAATGLLIDSNDDTVGISARISHFLTPGVYYIVAGTFDDASNGEYRLNLTTAPGRPSSSPTAIGAAATDALPAADHGGADLFAMAAPRSPLDWTALL